MKNRKNWMTLCLAAVLALSLAATAFAADVAPTKGTYSVKINGESTAIRGCVMVPLRAVAEKLGFTVTWKNGTVLVDDGTMHTVVTIGTDSYLVSTSVPGVMGTSAPFSLGIAPYVVSGVTYVPLALFDALLGSAENAVTVSGGQISIQSSSSENQLPNPFVACATLREAEAAAGFSMTLPAAADSAKAEISAIAKELIQVSYTDAGRTILLRKGVGTDDVSGDYNVYAETTTAAVGTRKVTMKGSAGTVSVAVWTDGGYAYAIDVDGEGLSAAAVAALVQTIR